MSIKDRAKAFYSNCRQMIAQYDKKRLDVEGNAIKLIYEPFIFDSKKVKETIEVMEKMLNNEEYEQVIVLSEEMMQLSLNGLNYYHNYYQRPLLITVTLSFMGWIMYLLKVIIQQKIFIQAECNLHHRRVGKLMNNVITLFFTIMAVLLFLIVFGMSINFLHNLFYNYNSKLY